MALSFRVRKVKMSAYKVEVMEIKDLMERERERAHYTKELVCELIKYERIEKNHVFLTYPISRGKMNLEEMK